MGTSQSNPVISPIDNNKQFKNLKEVFYSKPTQKHFFYFQDQLEKRRAKSEYSDCLDNNL